MEREPSKRICFNAEKMKGKGKKEAGKKRGWAAEKKKR